MVRRVAACLAASAVFLVLAGAALGASGTSATDQYGTDQPVATGVLGETATSPSTQGTLPFTGLSLAGAVALGVGLVGIGIVLRRRNATDEG